MIKIHDEVLYVDQTVVQIGTGEQSSTTTNEFREQKEEEEEYFYFLDKKGQIRRLLQYVNFDDSKSTQVEWIDKCSRNIICNDCYRPYHISPQCQVNL